RRLIQFVEEHNVTEISGFPYLLLEMNRLERLPTSLRLLISGGDVLRARYISNLIDKVEIYNTYGPSETTVCASFFRCTGSRPLADGTYPIGKPVLGAEMEIIDEDLRPVPDGEVGEICIFGDGVSRGYLGPTPESVNFTTMPDGRRVYRSGDMGYRLPDGNFAFLHRRDTQVMIMGKRVECDEVENALNRCTKIEQAAVCPRTDTQGLSYLTAYIVPRGDDFSIEELKIRMADYLTPYMIPEYFVIMQSLPLNANGKIDRKALPVIMKEGRL
ncbi:MAG: AMP-binding protein, partial [Clostridiales bacterium]|nr:AMP-binding protein [Clostridiales bacterium]